MGFLRILVKIVGILAIILGAAFISMGVYGLAGGTGLTFTINEREVSAQEGGQIFLIVGIVVFFVGIALTYIGFKKMK